MCASQMSSAVQRDDCLAGPGRAGDARWSGVVALDHLPLVGMQEDGPFLPREIERTLQFLDVPHHTEAAQGVGMIKGCRRDCDGLRHPRLPTCRQFQEGLGSLGGQVVRQDQQRVLGCCFHILEPLGRHAIPE